MNRSIDPIERARVRGEACVTKISAEVDANELERETLARLEKLVRHGYKFIDIIVRKDAQETRFEGDWIARLFRQESER
jgi:hypothetical protein